MSTFSRLLKHLKFPNCAEEWLQAQRLFHGRGHAYENLHHVTIDWLPPVLLITLYAPEPSAEIQLFGTEMLLLPNCKSVQLQHRYQQHGPIEVICGETIQQFSVQENNLRFHMRLGQSQNTGLFLDMCNGRQWVQENSLDKRILNLFSYTCGFSVAAIAGNAKSVLNIDMSSAALNVGRENHRLNHQSLEQVSFEKLNIFKSFGRLKKRGPFDLLICDPPTFQQGSVDIVRDYPKILRRLNEFMAPNSQLLLCLNAPNLSINYLIEGVAEYAPNFTFLNEIKPAKIFTDAQGKGLKVACFQNER